MKNIYQLLYGVLNKHRFSRNHLRRNIHFLRLFILFRESKRKISQEWQMQGLSTYYVCVCDYSPRRKIILKVQYLVFGVQGAVKAFLFIYFLFPSSRRRRTQILVIAFCKDNFSWELLIVSRKLDYLPLFSLLHLVGNLPGELRTQFSAFQYINHDLSSGS